MEGYFMSEYKDRLPSMLQQSILLWSFFSPSSVAIIAPMAGGDNKKAPPPVREHRRGQAQTCTHQASTGDKYTTSSGWPQPEGGDILKLDIDLPWGGKLHYERDPLSEEARLTRSMVLAALGIAGFILALIYILR